jgi:hypothetical protein
MANMDKANKAAERLAETTRDSFGTVLDHAVGLQERNVRFAQGLVDSSIKELRTQAEGNRALAEDLIEQQRKQREASQALTQESVNAYTDFLNSRFSYYRGGADEAQRSARQ